MDKHEEERSRIASYSASLFAEKGYDATRVNDIADVAKINKAKLYYYFESKEAILDYLIDSFYQEIIKFTTDFIKQYLSPMVTDGRLVIKPDRLQFLNQEAFDVFETYSNEHYDQMINYLLDQKIITRILLSESMKKGKHSHGLIRLFELINNVPKDFQYSSATLLFKFYFQLIPMISFASYSDEYMAFAGMSEQEFYDLFKRTCKNVVSLMVSGTEIIVQGN